MSESLGKSIKLKIEGCSRDESVSATICGLPAGFRPDTERLLAFMARRAPGKNAWSSARREDDIPRFESGIENGALNGKPLKIVIDNSDRGSLEKSEHNRFPRPSHADFAAIAKYGPDVDLRGGGHFSGRLTAPFCAAGGLCIQLLEKRDIHVFSHVYSISDVRDTAVSYDNPDTASLEKVRTADFPALSSAAAEKMTAKIIDAKKSGDSLGGVVECIITGLHAGYGEHAFGSVEAMISDAVFAIPGVKGIEFGAGFSAAGLHGSQNNDPFTVKDGRVSVLQNNAGGILGGMTSSAPIIFRVAFKPTPSIAALQATVDLEKNEEASICTNGRNDPCYVPRALPCVEAAAALAIYDIILSYPPETCGIESFRRTIDKCDVQIASALGERINACLDIGKQKSAASSVYRPERERRVLDNVAAYTDSDISGLYADILLDSKIRQKKTNLPFSGYPDQKIDLIGNPLSHSASPLLHSYLSDYQYRLKRIDKKELADYFKKRDFDGLNVTIPYKQDVIPFLDRLSDDARACGAVNTVVKESDGTLSGYNTDISGFISLLQRAGIDACGKKAMILGNGGAAKAVKFALEKLGAKEITVCSRNDSCAKRYDALTESDFEGTLAVNCTPCGMYPAEESYPFDLSLLKGAKAVIDLVYNPINTGLIRFAKENGIVNAGGLYMLVSQACASASLFCGKILPENAADIVYGKVLSDFQNVVLVGMPGCGKTSVGRRIAQICGRRFFDTDTDFEERTGYSPADYILKYGEKRFRDKEEISVRTASHLRGAIVSTGGGTLLREINRARLQSCGTVCFIRRSLCELPLENRPVSAEKSPEKLWEERKDIYFKTADITVPEGTVEEQADYVIKEMKLL